MKFKEGDTIRYIHFKNDYYNFINVAICTSNINNNHFIECKINYAKIILIEKKVIPDNVSRLLVVSVTQKIQMQKR